MDVGERSPLHVAVLVFLVFSLHDDLGTRKTRSFLDRRLLLLVLQPSFRNEGVDRNEGSHQALQIETVVVHSELLVALVAVGMLGIEDEERVVQVVLGMAGMESVLEYSVEWEPVVEPDVRTFVPLVSDYR